MAGGRGVGLKRSRGRGRDAELKYIVGKNGRQNWIFEKNGKACAVSWVSRCRFVGRLQIVNGVHKAGSQDFGTMDGER